MSLFVFVLMPFAKRHDSKYATIKCAANGMRIERVDEQSFHRQGITERIVHQIDDADIIIADMTTNNPNVLYEVGYAHAKNKLCVLLTRSAKKIPFDLKNRRHIVFSDLEDLERKLRKDIASLQVETELSFDKNDPECLARVPVYAITTTPVSEATSIRAKVRTSTEVHRRNVSAIMTRIERRIRGKAKRFALEQPIQLTWTDTSTTSTNFLDSAPKYVNVFHIDHRENRLTFWGVPMSAALSDFLSHDATYRVAISVMGKPIKLDIVWRGRWDKLVVKQA